MQHLYYACVRVIYGATPKAHITEKNNFMDIFLSLGSRASYNYVLVNVQCRGVYDSKPPDYEGVSPRGRYGLLS